MCETRKSPRSTPSGTCEVALPSTNRSYIQPPEWNYSQRMGPNDQSYLHITDTNNKNLMSTLIFYDRSLGGNRITGSIPKEIANISGLQVLVVEFNQMSGNLPPELGNLSQLQRLQISSNNFTGELPATLAKLTSLQIVQLSDNQFSGKIPDFIQSWTNLQQLVIQGSGVSGPIPSGLAVLGYLNDLRISDLNGAESSPFPRLRNMSMKNLILRSCNINGTLPTYLGKMTSLQTLDLSFNKLTGPIPPQYENLIRRIVAYMYLTGNFLTGDVPKEWINNANKKHYLDISYNNFSISGSQNNQGCQAENTNLFASSLTRNDTGKVSCLESTVCSKSKLFFLVNFLEIALSSDQSWQQTYHS
ncbi:hypothetical protein Ahy_A07g037176 isoform C [Arachis hypogaea]|nr:hypothetical protein Ahy_A07g037176 isoform C [Arachis hypogaea]